MRTHYKKPIQNKEHKKVIIIIMTTVMLIRLTLIQIQISNTPPQSHITYNLLQYINCESHSNTLGHGQNIYRIEIGKPWKTHSD